MTRQGMTRANPTWTPLEESQQPILHSTIYALLTIA